MYDTIVLYWYKIPTRYRDIIVRALKTFVQTLVPSIVAYGTFPSTTTAAMALLTPAASAALSAAWNALFPPEPAL